jgi:CheY-like chemotaxis protein
MSLVFEKNANYKTFSSPLTCLDFLKHYTPPSTQQYFLKSNHNDENYGILQHAPVDFDITKIAAFSEIENRRDEITAMLIDYHMPEMNGYLLSQSCGDLPVHKILLTGKTEDEKVIAGFNHNYIQRYIQKGTDNLEEKVVAQLRELSFEYFQKMTAPLLAHLEAENLTALSDPVFIDFFLDYCKKNNVAEFYLIDKQGSFLCIDKNNRRTYFVIHTDRSLNTWLDTYYTGTEFPSDFIEKFNARHLIPFFGMSVEAWQLEPSEWHTYFYQPQGEIVGREKYYHFEISDEEFRKGR